MQTELPLSKKKEIAELLITKRYTHRELQEKYKTSKGTIYRISQNLDAYLNLNDNIKNQKRIKKVEKNLEINDMIYNKVQALREKRLSISKKMIIDIGKKIKQDKFPTSELKFSNNWFKTFKK